MCVLHSFSLMLDFNFAYICISEQGFRAKSQTFDPE